MAVFDPAPALLEAILQHLPWLVDWQPPHASAERLHVDLATLEVVFLWQ
jgi:hypothetical protein